MPTTPARYKALLIGIPTAGVILLGGGAYATVQLTSSDDNTSEQAAQTPTEDPTEQTEDPTEGAAAPTDTDEEDGSEETDEEEEPDDDPDESSEDPELELGATQPEDYCWTDEEELAIEAATIMTTFQAAEDFNASESEMRARYLMHPERAEDVGTPERGAGIEWNDPAENNATSEVDVEPGLSYDSEGIELYASYQWHGDNDWRGSGGTRFYHFSMTDDPDTDDDCLVIWDYLWQPI